MNLVRSLRLETPARLALVGSGGKTTALFLLAHALPSPVWVTATTHLAVSQTRLGDRLWIVADADALQDGEIYRGVNVFTGPVGADQRTAGLEGEPLERLHQLADANAVPLLIEADGSKQKPLKAPAAHEPPIPPWVKTVGVCVGMSGVGKPLTDATVHHALVFSDLTGMKPGESVTIEGLAKSLCHPQGGLKNIPPGARRVAILNQADTADLQAAGKRLAEMILPSYDSVVIATLAGSPEIHAVIEHTAGIILAAGGSVRLGRPKQTLLWRGEPLIRHVARTALSAGLDPVYVV
ncbi:MAG: selenium cofactor biosynthesis protein YqeC, partial [Anaerolineaceae bacterium]